MPELPEVETMRRGVLSAVGCRIDHAERTPCPRKPISIVPRIDSLRRRLAGKEITEVNRIGKRVSLLVETGDALLFEPRMTGLLLTADPPSQEHVRFRLSLSGGLKEILYWDRRGLGLVRLYTPTQLREHFGSHRLGPDALVITVEELRQRLHTSGREIKVALLDQKVVAGIGNIYASEILHVAGVSPRKVCGKITRLQWRRIHTAMLEVLHAAILCEGSTLGDGTYRNALNQQGSYQNQHRVYAREGEPCPSCGHVVIVRIVQAQRSTYYCPKCQRK